MPSYFKNKTMTTKEKIIEDLFKLPTDQFDTNHIRFIIDNLNEGKDIPVDDKSKNHEGSVLIQFDLFKEDSSKNILENVGVFKEDLDGLNKNINNLLENSEKYTDVVQKLLISKNQKLIKMMVVAGLQKYMSMQQNHIIDDLKDLLEKLMNKNRGKND